MKTHSSLFFLIKKVILITLLLPALQTNASVSIEIENNEVIVTTTEEGKAGYKGCEIEYSQLVFAYEYTLYKKVFTQSKTKNINNQSCPSPLFKWIKVGKKKSNSPQEIFPNMPLGEYKATVLSGQAIGCSIKGDTQDYPTKSIVYHQEKSNTFDLSGESKREETPSIGSSDFDILKVFPNPTSGEINIQLKDHSLTEKATIVFYDLLGKETLRMNQDIKDKTFMEWQVDVSNFSGGAYLLRVFDQEGNSYEKKVMVIENK